MTKQPNQHITLTTTKLTHKQQQHNQINNTKQLDERVGARAHRKKGGRRGGTF